MSQEFKKWKPINTKAVIKNISDIFSKQDINLMTKHTYEFLYNLSGFIAHYSIEGFKHYYSDLRDLYNDLMDSHDIAEPTYYESEEFTKAEYSRNYYKSKAETLKKLREFLKTFDKDKLFKAEAEAEKEADIMTIKALMTKHNIEVMKND